MFHPPQEFVERLEREFDGRLRIRWSQQRHEWQIEQKIARGLFPNMRPTKKGWDETNDRYIRARDGYLLIMSVTVGTTTNCPRCGEELKVPFMETTHLRCMACAMRGRDSSFALVHFPLGDALIDWLKRIDPIRSVSEDIIEQVDAANAALLRSQEAQVAEPAVAGFSDRYNRIVGIPQVGYTGKVFRDGNV